MKIEFTHHTQEYHFNVNDNRVALSIWYDNKAKPVDITFSVMNENVEDIYLLFKTLIDNKILTPLDCGIFYTMISNELEHRTENGCEYWIIK